MRRKHKLLVGLASLTLFDIAVATAADLPVKARPRAPAPIYDWAGFYVGGHAGYRWAQSNFSSPGYIFNAGAGDIDFPPRDEVHHPNTGIFGVQAGFNVMLTPKILAGVEGDWSWGYGKKSIDAAFTGVYADNDGFAFRRSSEVELTWQATIRGRLGVVDGPWLVYGTGGVAFIHAKWSDASNLVTELDGTFNAAWTASKTLIGLVLGGGVEYMYTPKWTVRVEYLYEHFGSFNVSHGFDPQYGSLDIEDVHKLRVAISYKLGG
jgi:opacity protein-like surface antigen